MEVAAEAPGSYRPLWSLAATVPLATLDLIPVRSTACTVHWAAKGQGPRAACPSGRCPCYPGARPAAGDALRGSAVAFYGKAMAIRYNKHETASPTRTRTSLGMSKAAASQPPFANWTWAQTTGYLRPSHRGFPPKKRRAAAGSAVGPALLGGLHQGHKGGCYLQQGKKGVLFRRPEFSRSEKKRRCLNLESEKKKRR
jgi:hypothetical protein